MGARVTYTQIFIIAASAILMLSLNLFITKTRMGKAMRAVAQDKVMASLVGINTNTVISETFIIGSGLAAVAGLMVCGVLRPCELIRLATWQGIKGIHGSSAWEG